MQPTLAMCNIFDQDADRLAGFAAERGFSGIDWSIDPALPEEEFLARMQSLTGFQVRFHCRFPGVDVAYTDRRADDSLALLMRTVDQVARVGGGHMTVHSGLGNPTGEGIGLAPAIANLGVLVEHGRQSGVAVALENLTTPITNDPLLFRRIVAETDACVTIDIGHAHAVGNSRRRDNIFGDYIIPHRDRILNAHIYHTELDGYGHVPPGCLSDIHHPLTFSAWRNPATGGSSSSWTRPSCFTPATFFKATSTPSPCNPLPSVHNNPLFCRSGRLGHRPLPICIVKVNG